jgi:hypothetical protein
VADSSHFSQDIVDGLKSGLYHIGQSKEIAGNLRPAILNDKEQLVKFFTLKKSLNPTAILSDITMLSMQASLQRISAQLEDLSRDIKYVIDFSRREALSSKFIYARDRILLASTAEGEKRTALLEEADTYLMQGLSDLYLDIHAQIKELEGQKKKGLVASIKTIDKILSFISEDMQMIPRYVALRVYLFNYQNRAEDANRVLKEYRYQLQSLAEKKLGTGKYTAFELIHTYYPYDDKNVDFWLENPGQMLHAIDNFQLMLEQKDIEVYYIDSEAEHGRDYN